MPVSRSLQSRQIKAELTLFGGFLHIRSMVGHCLAWGVSIVLYRLYGDSWPRRFLDVHSSIFS